MTGVLLEHFDAPDDAVILIRDPDGELDSDFVFQEFSEMMQARFPSSFLIMVHRVTLEELEVDTLESMLSELIAHKKASGR